MKKIYFVNLFLLALLFLIDRVGKIFAVENFLAIQNHGLFLNFFHQQPGTIKVIALTTFAAFLFFVFIAVIYVLPLKLHFLRNMLTFIMAAVLGNTYDKFTLGYTIDYITVGSTAFNLADIWMFLGLLGINIFLFRKHDKLWKKDDNRRLHILDFPEQASFAVKFMLSSFCTSLIMGALAFSFLQAYLGSSVLRSEKILHTFIFLFLTISVLFCLVIFCMGIFWSHKIVGPLYALERHLDEMLEGKNTQFTMRERDYLKSLRVIADKIEKIEKR